MFIQATKDERGVWSISNIEHWTVTYDHILTKLSSNENFKFARYGDGEIYCMRGRNGANCDNHTYFADLGASLRATITEEPSYMVGIQPLSVAHLPGEVSNYFGHFKRLYNADVLHNASIDKTLNNFLHHLQKRDIILVGPPHLSSLFPSCVHIIVPPINCWLHYNKIRENIAFHLEGSSNSVVLLAASMMSEVIISNFENENHTFIDVGSVFDPYCGVKSRKYHHKLNIK